MKQNILIIALIVLLFWLAGHLAALIGWGLTILFIIGIGLAALAYKII